MIPGVSSRPRRTMIPAPANEEAASTIGGIGFHSSRETLRIRNGIIGPRSWASWFRSARRADSTRSLRTSIGAK